MPKNLNVGDTVFVPYSKFDPEFLERPKPFFETSICSVEERSVRVTLPDGEESHLIGSAVVHKNIGILIIQIGDFISEQTLLNPLSKTVLQYCRLLLGDDDFVKFEKCRTLGEFKYILESYSNLYQMIVLIGHGTKDSLIFGMNNKINASIIKVAFTTHFTSKKSIVSLCCKTGQKQFAGKVSKSEMIESFIAPFHSIHGVIASQFIQTYLANHLLNGMTDKTAFNRSVAAVACKTKIRFWQKGKLQKTK